MNWQQICKISRKKTYFGKKFRGGGSSGAVLGKNIWGGLAPLNFSSPPLFPTPFPSRPPWSLKLSLPSLSPFPSPPFPFLPPSPFLFPYPFLPLPLPLSFPSLPSP